MKKIDLKSSIDVESRLSRGQDRKLVSEIFNADPNFISLPGGINEVHRMWKKNQKSKNRFISLL